MRGRPTLEPWEQKPRKSRSMKGQPKRFRVEHDARVLRHKERHQFLTALLQTHEGQVFELQDRDYIRELKSRITKIKAQLKNMGEPVYFETNGGDYH